MSILDFFILLLFVTSTYVYCTNFNYLNLGTSKYVLEEIQRNI